MEREQYYKQFGWTKSPFIKSTSLDTPIIQRTREYQEICECIGGWDRIMVITAPIGYGKTTFMNQLVKNPPDAVDYIVSFDAYEPIENVIERIKNSLPLLKRMFKSKVDRTVFGDFLQRKLGGKKMLLLFDEAQDYEDDLFKWLRILNDRADNVFMIFFGLRELEDKITAETSFRDRKSKSITLSPFTPEELQEIVKKRITWVGGGDTKPFTPEGLKRLAESANSVPRRLMENGQLVIEEGAKMDLMEIGAEAVESVLGKADVVELPASLSVAGEEMEVLGQEESVQIGPQYVDFLPKLSPTQQEIVRLLTTSESLSISELSATLGKDIRSIGSLMRKLRGLNRQEVERKPDVPYPVVVRVGKERRGGRVQYVYALSDNARRLLA